MGSDSSAFRRFGVNKGYMPVQLKREGAWSVPCPSQGHVALFVDEYGHLCFKRSDGVVNYVVLNTIPPESGALTVPPAYMYEPLSPILSSEPVLEPPDADDKTLWDHLNEDE